MQSYNTRPECYFTFAIGLHGNHLSVHSPSDINQFDPQIKANDGDSPQRRNYFPNFRSHFRFSLVNSFHSLSQFSFFLSIHRHNFLPNSLVLHLHRKITLPIYLPNTIFLVTLNKHSRFLSMKDQTSVSQTNPELCVLIVLINFTASFNYICDCDRIGAVYGILLKLTLQ